MSWEVKIGFKILKFFWVPHQSIMAWGKHNQLPAQAFHLLFLPLAPYCAARDSHGIWVALSIPMGKSCPAATLIPKGVHIGCVAHSQEKKAPRRSCTETLETR